MNLQDMLWIVIKTLIAVTVLMLHVAYVSYFERKVIGHMQARMGPMRVGWHGLLQPIADGIKLFFKEDIIPASSDKPIFYIAPLIGLLAAIGTLAVIPAFEGFSLANLNIGVLYIFALSSVGSYSVILAGWASNSKYSFLGGLRSAAQVISYEIAMGLCLVGVMMLASSANLSEIVSAQSGGNWFILTQPVAFFVFLVAIFAETNRVPFDLPEAETELVAGYATEYSGIRFGLFFMAEYAGMFMMSSLGVVCFFGGWSGPGFLPGIVWFILKVWAFIFLFFWVRATFPRYRYDQLMSLGWKLFIPLALANIVITALVKLL
ncbi:MAG: NADH-quinone oxidoreductase subunit NuoH [Nitrospirota bacterium]